jgi:phosphoribosylanthranilate isomerase
MKIKVCGMAQAENLVEVGKLTPDCMGFIFFPSSPRNALNLAPEALNALPESIQRVGVFVNAPMYLVLEITQSHRLDFVQLHGSETPGYVASLAGFIPIIKAFPIQDAQDFAATQPYEGICEYFLFDTAGPQPGGNGATFDWEILTAYTGSTPFFLAGGIGPGHLESLKQLHHPLLAGVDLNSRFESEPGIKQVSLLSPFIQSLRNSR